MNTTHPQYREKCGNAGIIDDEEYYLIDKVQFAPPPTPETSREVRLRIPSHFSEHYVHNAVQIGLGTLQRIGNDIMVIAFPSLGKGPDGQPVPTIGKFEMRIATPKDIQRICELAKVINEENEKLAQAQATNPAMLLPTTIEGNRRKDEAVRQLSAAAQGRQPIITGVSLPKATANGSKIQLG